jgi:hypothetical protein
VDSLKSRFTPLALLIAAATLLAGVVLRPLWRDEYWALYFSGAELSLSDAITLRMVRDVHPPFYFTLLHFWRALTDAEIWARVFNLVALPLAAAAVWALGRGRRDETLAFLFLCAGSYWVIYFGVEVRMYAFVFGLCAITVVAARTALAEPAKAATMAAVFALAGAAAGASHFFAALWAAMLGFFIGLAFLRQGRFGAFVVWGCASAVAVAPTLAWIVFVSPQENPGAEGPVLPLLDALAYGGNQFLRGLVVKTFGSNLAAFAAALLCAPLLLRKRDPFDGALAFAVIGTVLVAFAIHLGFVPMIKERAFIVIMPGVIYLMVRSILAWSPAKPRAGRLIAAIPVVACVTPFLFFGEYFKDREQMDEVRAMIASAGDCAGAPVVMHYRPSEQAQDFHPFMLGMALRGAANGADIRIIDAKDIIAGRADLPALGPSACRVRALALVLPKGDGPTHEEARAELRAAGVPLDDWREAPLGRGRSLVWLEAGGS